MIELQLPDIRPHALTLLRMIGYGPVVSQIRHKSDSPFLPYIADDEQAFAEAWGQVELLSCLELLDGGAVQAMAVSAAYSDTYIWLRKWVRRRMRHLTPGQRERVLAYLSENSPTSTAPAEAADRP